MCLLLTLILVPAALAAVRHLNFAHANRRTFALFDAYLEIACFRRTFERSDGGRGKTELPCKFTFRLVRFFIFIRTNARFGKQTQNVLLCCSK